MHTYNRVRFSERPPINQHNTLMSSDYIKPIRIRHDIIQKEPLIMVSTCALFRGEVWGAYWLIETWVFSDSKEQRNVQVIHGTPGTDSDGQRAPHTHFVEKAKKVHDYIAGNLKKRFPITHIDVIDAAH